MTDNVPGPNETQLPRTEKYLRNRPFLVINFIHRPSKGVNTGQAGWNKVTGNVSSFEQPSLIDRVNTTHLVNASVIIDVINGKIVKNSFRDTPDNEIVTHYLEKYREQVTEAMDIWLTRLANKVAVAKKADLDATYSAA